MSGQAVVIDFEQARVRRSQRRDEPWVGKAEIAEYLGCSVRTVSRYMRDGMPYRKKYAQSRPSFQRGAVDEWMDQ